MLDQSSRTAPLHRRKTSSGGAVTLGPVSNLEEHVPSDWWRHLFNSVYLKTDGDVVCDHQITCKEVDLFSEILKMSRENRILDLCCGQGRHSLELARRGFLSVEGLDRSHYLIQRARMQAKKEFLNVKFREGDARKLPYPADTFDIVMILGNSFGYFETIQEDIRVVQEVFRVLRPGGQILIDIANGAYLQQHFQPRSWEWLDTKRFVCRERSLSCDQKRLISREIVNDIRKGIIVDQFYAERMYTRESMSELLKITDFNNVTFHGEISPDSQRNQDLGMMRRRIIVTAVVQKIGYTKG